MQSFPVYYIGQPGDTSWLCYENDVERYIMRHMSLEKYIFQHIS